MGFLDEKNLTGLRELTKVTFAGFCSLGFGKPKPSFKNPMKPKCFLPLPALAAIVLASSLHAQNGTWNVDADGNWNDAANWLGNITADGSGSTALFIFDLTANRTVTLGADRTIGNITFTDSTTSSNDLAISGVNILTLAGTTPTVSVTQAARTLTIGSEIAGTSGLTKSGLGALTLNGSAVNTFTGGLNISLGTLRLDYSNLATPTNLINSGNALTLGGGGNLSLTGKDSATNTAQTFTGTTLGIGKNTLSLAKGASATSATLNLGELTITPGAVTTVITGTAGSTTWATGVTPVADIISITGFNGTALPAGANKVNVNAGLFYRQTTAAGTARWVSVDSAGILQALPASIAAQATSGTVNVARQISTANITLVGNAESYGLVNNSDNAARQLSLGGFTYTINGIIGVNTNLLTIAPGTGGRLIIGSERNLVINSDNTGGTTISAPIDNNGSTAGVGGTASGVTITSTIPSGTPGTVTLSGANTYTGHTYINAVTVTLGNNSALGSTASGTTLIGSPLGNTTGTTLDLGASARTISENIHINGNALGRARIFSGAAVNHVLNGNIDVTSDTGFAQIWSNSNTGSIAVNGDITGTLTNGAAFLVRGTSTNAANQILGSINLTGGNLFKADAGTWLIGAAGETYSWVNTQVAQGTLRMGAANVLPSTSQLIMGQDATSNTPTLDLNGFSQTVAGIADLTNTSAKTITSTAGTPTLTVGDAGNYTYGSNGGVITGSVALTKTGAGSLTLANAGNTYTGATTVSAGTLFVTGALSASAVTVEANGAIGGSGNLGNGLNILAGGNLDLTGAAIAANSTGILSLTTGSTLTLGGLTFEDLIGWDWANAAPGTYELIDGDFTVVFGSTAFLSPETAFVFANGNKGYFTSGSLNAVIIPEPSAALLGGLGALLLLRRRR